MIKTVFLLFKCIFSMNMDLFIGIFIHPYSFPGAIFHQKPGSRQNIHKRIADSILNHRSIVDLSFLPILHQSRAFLYLNLDQIHRSMFIILHRK